jgi:TetR/AcrR family transcriptional regulator, tetracycline repressor protein
MTKKGSIDRQALIDAAVRVARRVGFEALSMRMVADELGVSAMAAYRHIPSREALITMVTDQLAAEVEIPDPASAPWHERLVMVERAAFAPRATFPGIPDAAEIAGGPEHDRLSGGVMEILLESGLDERDAAIAFQCIWAFFVGQLRINEPLLRGRAEGAEVAEAPVSPALARVLAMLPDMAPEDFFEFGLGVFVDGLKARLAADGAAPAKRPGPAKRAAPAKGAAPVKRAAPRSRRAGP